jgi:hypothetical protein
VENFEFFRDWYKAELERRNELVSAVGIPIAVLTGLGSAVGFMASGFSYQSRVINTLFVISLSGAVLSFAFATALLIRSYWGHAYAVMPAPEKVKKYRDELLEYHSAHGTVDKFEAEFKDFLERKLVTATQINATSNNARALWLHRANAALIAVLVCTTLAGVPYVIDIRSKLGKSPEVRVILTNPEMLPKATTTSIQPKETLLSPPRPTEQVKGHAGSVTP